MTAVMSKGHSFSFSSEKHSILYIPELRGYLLDGTTIIHEANVREVVLDKVLELQATPGTTKTPKEKQN